MKISETKELFEVMRKSAKINNAKLRRKILSLKKGNLIDTLISVHSFIRKNVQYKIEPPGTIQIRTPEKILREEKKTDQSLSSMLILGSAILNILKIQHEFVFAKIDNRSYFQYCFIRVPFEKENYDLDFTMPQPFKIPMERITKTKKFP